MYKGLMQSIDYHVVYVIIRTTKVLVDLYRTLRIICFIFLLVH
jgi:hypothetical protein